MAVTKQPIEPLSTEKVRENIIICIVFYSNDYFINKKLPDFLKVSFFLVTYSAIQ
jgi:hypothetical protein